MKTPLANVPILAFYQVIFHPSKTQLTSSYSSSSNESTEKELIDTDASTGLSEAKIIEAVITLFLKDI